MSSSTTTERRSTLGRSLKEPRDCRVDALGDLYPFTAKYLDIDGHRMHYVDEGDGPAVVMLHGNPTWSFHYRALILALRDRYRVVAPDHIGCGLSDKPRHYPYTLSSHIDNLERLIEALGLRDVTLVVHDWGGAIGFGWAVRHPQAAGRFVVFNSAAFPGGRVPFRIRLCRWPVLGDVLVRHLNAFVRASFRMATTRPARFGADVRRGYLLPYQTAADRVAIHRFVRDIPISSSAPSYDVLQSIERQLGALNDRPMLICWGMKDFCFTERFLEEWTHRFPHASVHRFEDAGHYVVEDAHERIAPLISEFLRTSIARPIAG